MQKSYAGSDKRLQYLFQNAKDVSLTRVLNSGTKIAEIGIDGQITEVFAPTQTNVSVNTIASQGTAIAVMTVNNQDYILYCPVASDVGFNTLVENRITAYETIEEGGTTRTIVVYDEPTYQVGKIHIDNGEEYELTTDTTVEQGKQYYELTTDYDAVTPQAGDSPVLLRWYERVNNAYVLSTDTTVVSGKTYYEREDIYQTVTPIGTENPSSEGWYELSASVFPVMSPPALGISYESNYLTGINVGKIVARYITHDPLHEDEATVADKQEFDIIIPTGGGGGSVVSYTQVLLSGTLIGRITIDGIPTEIYAPSGGGTGDVVDVRVNNESVVDENHVAHIDGMQPSLQDDIDRIYNVCVNMGQTPPSHGFADVMLTAMFAISGKQYKSVESTLDMGMRYFTNAKEE